MQNLYILKVNFHVLNYQTTHTLSVRWQSPSSLVLKTIMEMLYVLWYTNYIDHSIELVTGSRVSTIAYNQQEKL